MYHVSTCNCDSSIDVRCTALTAETLRKLSIVEDLERQFRACVKAIEILRAEYQKQANQTAASFDSLQWTYAKRWEVMDEKIGQLARDAHEQAVCINHNAVLLDVVAEKNNVTTRASRVRGI